jgi:ketosteroid isomerase-like protein
MVSNQTAEEIRRVAQLLDDAVESQDIESILSCFSDTGEVDVFGLTFKGSKEIRHIITWMYQRFGKIKFQPIIITVEGNIFFEEFTMSARFDGKEIEVSAAEVLVFENYKIIRLKLFLDRLEIAQVVSKGLVERLFTNWINREVMKGVPKIT